MKLQENIAKLKQAYVECFKEVPVQKLTDGAITPEEKKELTDALDKEKLSKSLQLDELEKQQSLREADIDTAIRVMEKVDEQWGLAQIDIKIRFQKMIFPEGVVCDTINRQFGTSQISPFYSYTSTEKGAVAPLKSYLVAGAGALCKINLCAEKYLGQHTNLRNCDYRRLCRRVAEPRLTQKPR